jgi:23S rRNA pseudouridine1911/1915/1917 synthase
MAAGEQVSADGYAPVPEFRIIEEDEHILVVDKPPGLVVHPGAGRASGTLMDAVLETRPEIEGVGEPGRWGVVHRLDRDTSGVMVMAKTPWAHRELSARFKAHAIHRVYLALVRGTPRVDGGLIDAAVGRHPKDRKRMSTKTDKPRTAVTEWRVLERLDRVSLLEILPQTGRTHQIRVHLASIGLPVAADRVYGKARSAKGNPDSGTPAALKGLSRQALHAAVLGFDHPGAGEAVEFRSPLPDDLAECLARCRSG